ncbi:MAG: HNH endonuclease [Acidobacteriota bacterium]|nr:HNH endonuclease [Acidobacteriota bacterium]
MTSYKLEIEHIYPISKGGTSEKENLCLACRKCNLHKSSKVFGLDPVSAKRIRLFNPNLQNWLEHFVWDKDKSVCDGKRQSKSCG